MPVWMVAPEEPRPAACIHSPHSVTWPSACLSLHLHIPEQSGGKMTLFSCCPPGGRAGWAPGSAGRAEALPAQCLPVARMEGLGNQGGWPGPPHSPRRDEQGPWGGTSRGLRDQRPAGCCHHAATQEAGPPSLPQREEERLEEVKGPGGAKPDHGPPHRTRDGPGPPGATPRTLHGHMWGEDGQALSPPGAPGSGKHRASEERGLSGCGNVGQRG